MKQEYPATEEHTRPLVKKLFGGLSKGELLAVVFLMHRILDADRRRDIEQLVTELPMLFAAGSLESRANPREEGGFLAKCPSKGDHTYHLLNYFFSCLSKAQSKIDTAQAGRSSLNKRSCHLSPRELTVLRWMKEGKTNWEIARILGLSERTVRFHVGSIFEKLDVTSRTQAVARALGAGLIAS